MRRLIFGTASLALLLLAGAPQASAQFYVGGGVTMPSGDYGDYAKSGWIATAGYTFWQSMDGRIGISAGGAYGSNKHDADVLGVTDGDKTDLLIGYGQASYALSTSGSAMPYIAGMVGYLSHKYSPETGDSESEGGLGFGGGVGVKFNKFWVDGRYFTASIDGESTAFIAVTAGVSF